MRRPPTLAYLSVGAFTLTPINSKCAELPRLFAGVSDHFVPSHFGFFEPIRSHFTLDHAETLLASLWESPLGDSVNFVFRESLKGYGTLSALRTPRARSHYIRFEWEFDSLVDLGLLEQIRALLRNLTTFLDAVYGYATLYSSLRGGGWYRDYEPQQIMVRGVEIPRSAIVPQPHLKCIPGLVWLNVLGPDYVEFIGEPLLRATQPFHLEGVDGRLWLQLTQSPEQIFVAPAATRCRAFESAPSLAGAICSRSANRSEYRGPAFDRSRIRVPVVHQ